MNEAVARHVVERLAHHRLDAEAVEVAHRVDARLELGEQLALRLVERPHPDERNPRPLDSRQSKRRALELRARQPQRRRERHPVHVSRG